ncbi:pilus assembly protein FimV [Duganella sp. SG902]|uniref:FimV/HubP family polar landmark protein n=1 Tax=Duganella sp. SG902 TaxID=2587016 RepID=UPI00181C41C1|nr:FimV/HubP family polar landmark protein [Duganella sp. SG902]NVM77779.1 pilus assembly protein FimV [Duganella sp. SG902]
MKSLTSAVASAVLLAASANAAGLGKLTVLSALGQPLRAEIELTAVTPEEASALVAKLAPAEAFRSANIDFNPALLSLRFDVEPRNGKQVIKVSSSQPINEPFVDMLLELNWTGGRMVREYTFLLDPPDLRATQAPQVTAPVDVANRPAAAAQPAPATPQAAAPAAAPARPAAAPAPAPASKPIANEYTVKAGDNLTRIANQVKPVDVSLDLMLVALYRANPEAFSGNNMNRLKSGQILSVPDADAIRAAGSESEARGVVVAHAADFNAYRAKLAGQVAASTAAKEPDASQNVSGKITAKVEEKPNAANTAKDKLTLSKATASAPQQGKTGVAAEEDKIAKQKAVDEASARVKELEKNVNDLEKLMALKSKTASEAKKPSAPAEASAAASGVPTLDVTPQEHKPKRTLVLPPKKLEPSFFEVLMDNITYVGAAAAAVLLGVVGIMASRRRKKFVVPAEEPSILGDTALPPPQPLIADAGGQSVDTNNSVFNSNFAPSASQLDTNEVDPVAEADVYIAYGRDAQAEEILKEALRTHPERHAVRLKLLEIYVTRKDARAFETQASELYALTRGQGGEWEQAAALGRTLDPSNPLYTMGADSGNGAFAATAAVAGAAAAGAAAATDFGNDFGNTYTPAEAPAAALDLDLSQDAAPPAPADAPAPAPAAAADFNDLDFGADLDTALPQAADATVSPASVAAEADNLMDFDLGGLSFEPADTPTPAIELPAAESPAPAPAPADDLGMDFGLDLPASAAPAETRPADTSDPLDLDLAGFDIPEVPAFTEPPKAEAAAPDFDAALDLPPEVENITAAPPPAAQEFDLSGIDLDLDNLGGAATPAASEAPAPAPAPDSGEPLSAHHMEMDTKLDLAVAYQEIGDKEGARELLDEVLRGGNAEQVAKANAMKAQLG